ncbi:MAG: bifunctional folylpolyglutamate synthase/dihydrofolate synthase [Planctomycetota bacterium]|nr:bifunctional folylpolyglutamate synthase/dihydrofolate synthase [Planctomycetota bacterium]
MSERQPLPDRIASRADFDALLATTTNYEERLPRDPLRKALDLERVRALLAAVGDPQHGPRTAHIAGSKGKGTVARMIAAGLRAAGRQPVGLYTSPHLEDLAERVEIDGVPAPDDALARAATRCLPHLRATRGTPDAPTFFELFTAIAWLVFREAGCSDVVLETGLGGRLDATNVCAPAVTVLTLIELEHTRLLGSDLPTIAAEKAGIIKAGVPAIMLEALPEVAAVFEARALALGAPLQVARADDAPQDLRLVAPHLRANAAAAHMALRLLDVEAATAWRAMESARLPGILEQVSSHPRVVIDGAHTARSAAATRAAVAGRWPGEDVVLLTAVLDEKDVVAVVGGLARDVKHIVITRVHSPRCLDPAEVATRIRAHVEAPISVQPDLALALGRARALAGSEGTVLASGSLYLAGAVRTLTRPARPATPAS